MRTRLDFSSQGRARVAAVTILGTLGTVAIALYAASYIGQFVEVTVRPLMTAAALLLPLLMSAPVYYFFANKLRQLAIAHHQLALLASQDSLTTCLNRGAFSTLVDAYLRQVNAALPIGGALLMIDADHFTDINDRYGHAYGDTALKLIAETMKNAVRPTDLVGRVGGEEFAVFLPRADSQHASAVAERIRVAVSNTSLAAAGPAASLSVSVGAVVFEGQTSVETLFQAADALLYEAKRLGRNRVVLRPLATARGGSI